MTFIPPASLPPASPRARELAQSLIAQIQDFKKEHPDASEREVWAALRLASISTRSNPRANWGAVTIALMVTAILLVGLAVFGLQSGVIPHAQQMLPLAVVVVSVVVVVAALIIARASGDEQRPLQAAIMVLGGVALLAALALLYIFATRIN